MSGDLGQVEPLQEILAVGQVLTLLVDLAEEEVQDVLCVALLISLDVVRIYLIPGEKKIVNIVYVCLSYLFDS